MDYIEKHQIPVISTNLDTLGAYTKINQIEVKINTDTPWKVKRAIELIKNHVDLEKIMASFLRYEKKFRHATKNCVPESIVLLWLFKNGG